MASKKRRILVTGVARWWGALLVQKLVEDPDVAEVIGIDIREPRYDLGRADYLKLDVRHSLIGKLVRAVGIDTVVHTLTLSLIHISEPTRLGMISYAVFCLKKKKK